MNKSGLTRIIKAFDWYRILFVPAFILLLTDFFRAFTPVLDALPSEFPAQARLAAVFAALISLVRKDEGTAILRRIILPLLAFAGLLVLLETGIPYVLDASVFILLIIGAGADITALSVFVLTSCIAGSTVICSFKGFIRDYTFNGINAFGFRNITGLFIITALLILSGIVTVLLVIREKKLKATAAFFCYALVLTSALFVFSMKALNLSAAVEPGDYAIFAEDTALGIEVRMKGFDDFNIGFGSDEPTPFYITPDGDHYLITMNSYGITKTMCVIDGELIAGNYEQSESAHNWDIETIRGTPYFTVRNTETGLYIQASDDGTLSLAEDEGTNLRIGDENLSYYEGLAKTEDAGDLSRAMVIIPEKLGYTGSAVRPEQIEVVLDGQRLTEGEDYQVTYWNNYLPGTAWADITGIGDYTGKRGASFEIVFNDPMCDDPFYANTSDYVIRVFRMAYLRYPTLDEVRLWVQMLVGANRTPDSVVWEVYNNGGFRISDPQFIEAMYRLMLLRNGSRGELLNWINELRGGATREDVIDAISFSPDYQNIWHSFGISYR